MRDITVIALLLLVGSTFAFYIMWGTVEPPIPTTVERAYLRGKIDGINETTALFKKNMMTGDELRLLMYRVGEKTLP